MKILIAAVFVIMAVEAEYCQHDSDCTITECGANFHVDCFHRDNVCTCLHNSGSSYSCYVPGTCADNFGACHYHDHHWHCQDNRCRCRTYHD